MENINKLIAQLIAICNYSKDIHYNSKGEAFYGKHLLADRVQENINEYIDQIKELFFLANNKEPKGSKEYLRDAIKFIPDIKQTDKESFKELANLLIKALKTIEQLTKLTKGEENLIGAIGEDIQTSLGLVNREVIDDANRETTSKS